MNRSNEFGVIVFTIGSLVAMHSLPDSIIDTFKSVFSQLSQTIIWKYENDQMIDKSKNVILCKWLPQRDILREFRYIIQEFFSILKYFSLIKYIYNYYLEHPSVKLFISHGGISGMYEAVEAGVPVLGVPLFYDQPRNVQNLVNLGMALSLDINNINQTTILLAINLLLNNQR